MGIRRNTRAMLLLAIPLPFLACKTAGPDSSVKDAINEQPEDRTVLETKDDCEPIRKAIATGQSQPDPDQPGRMLVEVTESDVRDREHARNFTRAPVGPRLSQQVAMKDLSDDDLRKIGEELGNPNFTREDLVRRGIFPRIVHEELPTDLPQDGSNYGQPATRRHKTIKVHSPKKGFYECAAPIIMDHSNMTLIGDNGVDNGQVKIRLADGARAPMIVIGTIDSTFKSPIRDRITGVRMVEVENFELDGNRFGQIEPFDAANLENTFLGSKEVQAVFDFGARVARERNSDLAREGQAVRFDEPQSLQATVAMVQQNKAVKNSPLTQPMRDALRKLESETFKVLRVLRDKLKVVPDRANVTDKTTGKSRQETFQEYSARMSQFPNKAEILDLIAKSSRLNEFVLKLRQIQQVHECYGREQCDSRVFIADEFGDLKESTIAATAGIRNNGVTIRGADLSKVRNVKAFDQLSGGMVTEKGCSRLLVDGFESTTNFFDGFAGYQTIDSLFLGMNLHNNNNAGISIDIDFSYSEFSTSGVFGKSKFLENGDVGIFARESEANKFTDVEIISNRNHGVFIAQGNLENPDTKATDYEFSGATIERSEGVGVRINDRLCTGNSLVNSTVRLNMDEGLSAADNVEVIVKNTNMQHGRGRQ